MRQVTRMAAALICMVFLCCACDGAASPEAIALRSPTATRRPTNTPTAIVLPTIAQPTRTPGALCVAPEAARERAWVIAVIDGDTIDVRMDEGVFRVRYIGIDTPESSDPRGDWASAANADLVLDKEVILIRDVSETDRYERLLRYVFVDGMFVNLELVRQGAATAGAWPPDTACYLTFLAAEKGARDVAAGIWSATDTQEVPVMAGSTCPQGCTTHLAGCDIKGNISYSSGEKIFHVPGQENYEDTVISPDKGERWFCTEAEATANGWRKAKR